jgi:signal transduction histidine kinase
VLKFHQIILRKFLTLFLTLFLIVGAIVYYWTYEFYIQTSKESLAQDTELLSLSINKNTNLDELALKVKKRLHLRLTVISEDGEILAESHRDKNSMDNHKYRAEIIQAREDGMGYKLRHSTTLDKDLLYVAKRIQLNNHPVYIRLSQEVNGIQTAILYLGLKIFAVIILFFIAIITVSYKINKEISYETNKIVEFLTSLTKKNKQTYIASNYSQEFAYITNLLTKISQIIVKKEKQKSKYTQRLQRANKQKDDIISAISHEFKNPIAVVNGYSQTLLDDTDINPNIRKKFLQKIHKNGAKLSSLIDTLRLSIKLDSEQQKIQTKTCNLYELVKEATENIKINYQNRETIIIGEHNLKIQVDETLFGIVIANLLENAYKYSEDEVHINITKKYFEVIDTGVGIAKKDLENITKKFYRANSNKWNNSLGLGLFLVNNIVNLHGFKLEVKSKENEGSSFRIYF